MGERERERERERVRTRERGREGGRGRKRMDRRTEGRRRRRNRRGRGKGRRDMNRGFRELTLQMMPYLWSLRSLMPIFNSSFSSSALLGSSPLSLGK